MGHLNICWLLLASIALALTLVDAQRDQAAVVAINTSKTITSSGTTESVQPKRLTVNGVGNKIVSGSSEGLSLAGSQNRVTASGPLYQISVSGSDNQATLRIAGGSQSTLTVLGNKNVVVADRGSKVTEVYLSGTNNRITTSTGPNAIFVGVGGNNNELKIVKGGTPNLSVTGNSNHVIIVGDCRKIVVGGTGNKLVVHGNVGTLEIGDIRDKGKRVGTNSNDVNAGRSNAGILLNLEVRQLQDSSGSWGVILSRPLNNSVTINGNVVGQLDIIQSNVDENGFNVVKVSGSSSSTVSISGSMNKICFKEQINSISFDGARNIVSCSRYERLTGEAVEVRRRIIPNLGGSDKNVVVVVNSNKS